MLRWERGIPGIHLADAPCRHTSSRSRSPRIPPFLMPQSLTNACEIWHAVRRRQTGAGHVDRCTEAVFKGRGKKGGPVDLSHTGSVPVSINTPDVPARRLQQSHTECVIITWSVPESERSH